MDYHTAETRCLDSKSFVERQSLLFQLSTADLMDLNEYYVCMTLPGGGLRLQTSGGLASQLFDSTLRTCCRAALCPLPNLF